MEAVVETSVQSDLDNAFGKNRGGQALCNRQSCSLTVDLIPPYNADPQKEIMEPDAFVITCHGYNSFWMPGPFPTIPWFGYLCQIDQSDLLDAYRKSAKKTWNE